MDMPKAQRRKMRETINFSNITAVILAGGLGTRLRPAISDKPKVLAEVLGRSFLTYLLDQLSSAGACKVILCTGYMGDKVQAVYGDTYRSLNLLYSQEDKPLGTGGALRLALPLIESDYVLVMNGDSYVRTDLSCYAKWFLQGDKKASLVLVKVLDTIRYGMVAVEKDETVSAFKEKERSKGAGWINAGIYLIKTSFLETIPVGRKFSLERKFFPSLVGNGLFGYQCKGEFIDIGTPESYAAAEFFFNESKVTAVEKNIGCGGQDL